MTVIGAGQAGLGAAYYLRRAGLTAPDDFVVLDHAPHAGGAWQFRWPTLTFRTVNGIFKLPGLDVPDVDVDTPVAGVISDYFRRYEEEFELRVRRPVSVRSVRGLPDGLLEIDTDVGRWRSGAIINATGTWERPFWPYYPGFGDFRGRHLHTAQYRGPDEFTGQKILVVGGGISAVQHVMEIHRYAAEVTWVTRSQPRWLDGAFTRERALAAVNEVERRVRAGLPPQPVVSATGIPLTDEVRAALDSGVLDRREMFRRINSTGVEWPDGRELDVDVILWATGFRPNLDHLHDLNLRSSRGGIRMNGTVAAADERVHLVGYGPSASTVGANRAGRRAAREARSTALKRWRAGKPALSGADRA